MPGVAMLTPYTLPTIDFVGGETQETLFGNLNVTADILDLDLIDVFPRQSNRFLRFEGDCQHIVDAGDVYARCGYAYPIYIAYHRLCWRRDARPDVQRLLLQEPPPFQFDRLRRKLCYRQLHKQDGSANSDEADGGYVGVSLVWNRLPATQFRKYVVFISSFPP